MKRSIVPFAAVLALLAIGCSGDIGTPTSDTNFSPTATRVVLAPSNVQLVVGASTAIVATVFDQRDSVMTATSVTWSSSNFAVATVSSSGVVRGVAVGSATISATAGTVSASASVTVIAPTALRGLKGTPAIVAPRP